MSFAINQYLVAKLVHNLKIAKNAHNNMDFIYSKYKRKIFAHVAMVLQYLIKNVPSVAN